MKKKLLWIVLGVIALFFIVVIAAFVIVLTFDYNKLKPEITQAAYDATGRKLAIDGDIKLKIGLTPSLIIGKIGLENAPWGSRKQMVKIESVEVKVALWPLIHKKIRVKRFAVIGPDILIEANSAGKLNVEFDAPRKPAEAAPKEEKKKEEKKADKKKAPMEIPAITLDDVRVENGTFAYKDARTGASYNVKLNKLLISAADIKGPISISLDGAFEKMPFNASLKFSMNGDMTVFKVSNLEAGFAGSDLAGSLEAKLSGARPYVKADLKAKKFDLKALMKKDEAAKPAAPAPAANAEPPAKYVFPRDPIPLDGLKQADADVKLSAASILLPGMLVKDASVDLSLHDGVLNIKPMKAKLGGGDIKVELSLKAKGKAAVLTLTETIRAVDVGAMLKDLGITDIYEGKVDADIEISGEGENVAAIMASLDGKVSLAGGAGKLSNSFVEGRGNAGKMILKLLSPGVKAGTNTVVGCTIAGFDIKDGIATSSAIVVNTDLAGIVGSGKVDLRTEKLDFRFKAVDKKGALGKTGLSDFVSAAKLGGRIASPDVEIDAAGAALALGKKFGGKEFKDPAVDALLSAPKGSDSCSAAAEAVKKGGGVQAPEKEATKLIKEKAKEKVDEEKKKLEKKGKEELKKQLKNLFNKR